MVRLEKDEQKSRDVLAKLIANEIDHRRGLVDRFSEHATKRLADHLADWQQFLRNEKQNTPAHVATSITRVATVFDGCGFVVLGDVAPEAVGRFLAARLEAGSIDVIDANGRKKRFPFGNKTHNHYLAAAQRFCNWAVKFGRLAASPLGVCGKQNEEVDERRHRRVLSDAELAQLIAHTQASRISRAMLAAEDRAMVYRVAVQTGLRAKEIASLRRSHFVFDAATPHLTVKAATAKNRKNAQLPLKASLVAALKEYLPRRLADVVSLSGDALVWPGGWHRKAADMIYRDMAAARRAWIEAAQGDERNRCERSTFLVPKSDAGNIDFHSLRHTFITNLARAGVHAKVAQELARHSSIELTMSYYTHLQIADLAKGLDAVPEVPAVEAAAALATGTDGPSGRGEAYDSGDVSAPKLRAADLISVEMARAATADCTTAARREGLDCPSVTAAANAANAKKTPFSRRLST